MADRPNTAPDSLPTSSRSAYRMGGGGYGPDRDPCGGPRLPSGQRRFDETAALVKGMRFHKALEVGCEAGFFLERLASLAERVVGVELHAPAAAAARRRLREQARVRVLTGNFLTLPLPRDFDLACAVHVFTDFEPLIQVRLLQALRERLVPGGHLLCTVTSRRFGLFSPDRFLKLLGDDFEILKTHSFPTPGRPRRADFGNLAVLARLRR